MSNAKTIIYGRTKTLIRLTNDLLVQYDKESFKTTDLDRQEILLSILDQNYKTLRDRLAELQGKRSQTVGSYVNFMEEKD